MRVRLAYDRAGLGIALPDDHVAATLDVKRAPPLPDPAAACAEALKRPFGGPPLRELARGRRDACVVVSDVTRPVPNAVLLPPLLAELEAAGLPRVRILLLVATGLHRPNVGPELREVVGAFVFENYRIENHDARALDTHLDFGRTPQGVPVQVDRRFAEADLRIVTGLVEPHLMAGYSGGRKAVLPGVSSAESIMAFHSPPLIEHERSRTGRIEGNRVHAAALEAARRVGVHFMLNVVINRRREPVGFFAGDLEAAFDEAVALGRSISAADLDEPADVVVTTGGGHPLDTTWYQAVKGVAAAMPAVREGGTILIAAGLREGLGGPEFTRLCLETDDIETFMRRLREPGFQVIDQWQLEELGIALRKARVMLYTDGLDADVRERLCVEAVDSVEAGVATCVERYGPNTRIVVIPPGPYVNPCVVK